MMNCVNKFWSDILITYNILYFPDFHQFNKCVIDLISGYRYIVQHNEALKLLGTSYEILHSIPSGSNFELERKK